MLVAKAMEEEIKNFLAEDALANNLFYLQSLPRQNVSCSLYIKSDMMLTGLPFFFSVFKVLGHIFDEKKLQALYESYEGKTFAANEKPLFDFDLPFALALSGERLALNLLAHSSKISTYSSIFVERAREKGISIIDTRKTTPGLRSVEKYAVRMSGAFNHRLSQTDIWMVKDNHKNFFGSLPAAVDYFRKMQGFYTPIIVEVHNLTELQEAIDCEVKHVMLDNFTPTQIKQAIDMKEDGMSYEVSGGVNLDNIESYLISGVDAISIGRLTYGAPPVDISFKYKRLH